MQKSIDDKLFAHIATGFSLQGSYQLEGIDKSIAIDYLARYLMTCDIASFSLTQVALINELQKAFNGLLKYAEIIDALRESPEAMAINSVAESIAQEVLRLGTDTRLLIPGGWFRHAVVYEFKREGAALLFSIYNSGRGIEYHEQRAGKKQQQFSPTLTYKIKDFYTATPLITQASFQSGLLSIFIQSLLMANFYPTDYHATRMYTEVYPQIYHLGGEILSVVGRIPEHAWREEQLAGVCVQEVLYRVLQIAFTSLATYERFVFEFKQYALKDYLIELTKNERLQEPAVRHQLIMAIEDSLRILNQPSLFSAKEQRDKSALLLEYQRELSLPKARLPVEQPAIAILPSIYFNVKSPKTLSINMPNTVPRLVTVWDSPILVRLDKQLLEDIERVVQRCGRLCKASRYQDVIEQIEIVFTSLPLPSHLGQLVDSYVAIDSLSKAENFTNLVAGLQKYYEIACQQLYAGAQVPSMFVTQLSLLAVLDYVNTINPISDQAVNSLMRSDITRILRFHQNDPYLITNRPALDSRLYALKKLYEQNSPKFDDAKYLSYYSAIIDTNPIVKEWLKNEYAKLSWDHARKPAALRMQAIEELYYFITRVMNRPIDDISFSIKEALDELSSRFRHELQLELCFVNALRLFSGERFPEKPRMSIAIGFCSLADEQVKVSIKSPSKDNDYRVSNKRLLRTKYNLTPNSIYQYALAGDHEVVEHAWQNSKPFDNVLLLAPLTTPDEKLYDNHYISISPKPVGITDIEARELFQLRSVPELQLTLTMNYVARHMDKWTNKDFRLYVEANITERLSADITTDNPILKTLDELVRRFTYKCRLEEEAIYLIRLSYLVAFAIDYSHPRDGSRLTMCQELIASLIAAPQDEAILTSLYRYQFLTLMAQVELGLEFNKALPRLLTSYFFMQAKQSKVALDTATVAEINLVLHRFKRSLSCSPLNAQMVKEAISPVLGRFIDNYKVSGRYPIFSAKASGQPTYILDVERGLISSEQWVILPIPLDILQHPFLQNIDFSSQSTCKQSIDGFITTIDIPFKGSLRFIANPNQTEPKYTLQKKWGKDWYELHHLSDAQKNALGFYTKALDIKGLSDILMDSSSQAWVCCDDSARVLLTKHNVPCFVYRPNDCQFKQLRVKEKALGNIVAPDFFLCDNRNAGIASLFQYVESPSFLVVTTNGKQLNIDFSRYGLQLTGDLLGNGQWEFYRTDSRDVLLLGQSAVAPGVASLVFASVDNPTQKRCVLMVQPFINTGLPSQMHEYYQLQQDVSGLVPRALIGDSACPLWQYSLSERFIELPMQDDAPYIDKAVDALFLAYVYLGVGQHEKAWAVLDDCARRIGGLQGTYDELFFLQWIVDELPFQLDEQDEKAVRLSQDDVACKLKALALLTDYHRLGRTIVMPKRPTKSDTDNEYVAQKRQERVNNFYNEIASRIKLHYARYQNLALHASAPFYLSDNEQKSLLSACSLQYGSIAYQSKALEAAAIKQERTRLIERQNYGPLDKDDSMRLKAIEGLLRQNLPVRGLQTKPKLNWISIKLLKQPPDLADEVLNVPAITDESALQNAVDALSPYMTDQDFFKFLPSYYELACCHEPVELHQRLVDFSRNTIRATYQIPVNRHRKAMTYICYSLYAIATTQPDMSAEKWRQIPKHTLYGLTQLAYDRNPPEIPVIKIVDDSSPLLTDNLWDELPEPLERVPLMLEAQNNAFVASMDEVIRMLPILANFYTAFQSETEALQIALDRLPNPPAGRVLSKEEQEAGLLRYTSLQSLKKLVKTSPIYYLNVQQDIEKIIKPYIMQLTEVCGNQQEALLKLANLGPSDTESALRWQLDIASRKRLPLDLNAVLLLYFKADVALYIQETGLDDADITALHRRIAEFVATSTHLQQVQRVYDKLIKVINMLDEAAKDTAIFQLAQIFCERNQIDTLKAPALALIQYHSNLILRPRQIKAITSLLAPFDAKKPYLFQELIEELLPGQGKTEVIAPAIALQKANGLNLVVVETLPSLLNKTHANLNHVSQTRFRQTAHRFEFSREDDRSSVRLENIYQRLVSIQRHQDYLVTTGDSIQALELNYFELLYSRPAEESGLMYEWSRQVNAAEKIVKLLLERADVLMDEVHLVLWIKKRLNYALGGQQPISRQLINDCVTLYKFLGEMTVMVDGVQYSFIQALTQPSFISQDLFQSHVMCLAELTGPLSGLLSSFSSEEQQEITAYLKNEGTTIPLCIVNAKKSTQDTLEVYKLQLNQLLAQTTRRRFNVHYGPSRLASIDAMTRAVAIPYSANNQPNEGSQFEQVLESINYTIQSLLIAGLTDDMVREFLRKLQADALQQVQQSDDKSMTLDDTWVALAYKKMTQGFAVPVFSAIDLENEAQSLKIAEVLRHNQALIYDVLKRCILPKIMLDKKVLHSNAYHHVDMVHSCQGMTGTAGNSATYHQRIQFNPKTNVGNNAFVVKLLKEKQPDISIRGIDFQETKSFIKQLFPKTTKPILVRAIIDISATFQGIENRVVAAALANYISENTEQWQPSLRYVLFYNEDNVLCAYHVLNRIAQELVATKETADIDRQLGCTVDERMMFYDNLHAIGENIAQADTAIGLALVDEQTTLDAFIQGMMRMRGLQDRQSIELIVPSKWANKNLDDIILNMASIQQQELSQELYEAACEKMTNVLRNDLKRRVLSAESIDEKCRLAAAFQEFFIESLSLDWFKTHGGLYRAQETKTLLERHLAQQLEKWQQAMITALQPSQRTSFESECETLKHKMQSIINDALIVCEKTQIANLVSLGTQVETIKEQFKQHQIAEQLPAHIHEMPYQSLFNEDLMVAYEFLSNVKPLQALYNDLTELNADETPRFADNLYVSQNFYQCYKGQTQFVGRYQKPVLVLLFRLHDDGRLDCLLISQQDARFLISSVEKSSKTIWLSDTNHTVLKGTRPECVLRDMRYHDLITQVRFYNGELRGLLDEPGAITWLQEKTSEKITFFKRCVLPYRDVHEEEIEQLRQALSETVHVYRDIAERAPQGDLTTIDWRTFYPDQQFSDEDVVQLTALAEAIRDANAHWEDNAWLALDKQTQYSLQPRALGVLGYYVDELQQLRELLYALERYYSVQSPLSRVFITEKYQHVLRRFSGETLDFTSQERLNATCSHALKILSTLPFLKDDARWHIIVKTCESSAHQLLPKLEGLKPLSFIKSSPILDSAPRVQTIKLNFDKPKGLGIQSAVVQLGHECKTTAIATVEAFYADQVGYEAIPLRKDGGRHVISIRELAKQHGSVQGELLEVHQLIDIFHDIGIDTELLDFTSDITWFKQKIQECIKSGDVPIVFFTVSRDTGLPTIEGVSEEREHAAIINYYSPNTDELEIIHWGQIYHTTANELYHSSAILSTTRQPELYEAVDLALRVDPDKKYEKRNRDKSRSPNPIIKQSIVPQQNTGFRCKMLIAKRPTLEKIHMTRNSHFPEDLYVKLQQELMKFQCYLHDVITLNPDNGLLIFCSNLLSQLNYRYGNFWLMSPLKLDRVIRVIQKAHHVIQCYVDKSARLSMAMNDLDVVLQKIISDRQPRMLPQKYWSLLNNADVYGLFSELIFLLEPTFISEEVLALLNNTILKKNDLFKIIHKVSDARDALLVSILLIKHCASDLDVCIALIEKPVFFEIFNQKNGSSDLLDIINSFKAPLQYDTKRLFAEKIQELLMHEDVSEEQLLSIISNQEAYLGTNKTAWASFIGHLARYKIVNPKLDSEKLLIASDQSLALTPDSLIYLLRLLPDYSLDNVYQMVIRLILMHPKTDLSVLIAIHKLISNQLNMMEYLKNFHVDYSLDKSDLDYFQSNVKLFKKNLMIVARHALVSTEQLLNVLKDFKWFLNKDDERYDLLSILLSHTFMNETVLDNLIEDMFEEDAPFAAQVLESPYMTKTRVRKVVEKVSYKDIYPLYTFYIWNEKKEWRSEFFSISKVRYYVLEGIDKQNCDDECKYKAIKNLCEVIQPHEDRRIYSAFLRLSNVTCDDFFWLLSIAKRRDWIFEIANKWFCSAKIKQALDSAILKQYSFESKIISVEEDAHENNMSTHKSLKY